MGRLASAASAHRLALRASSIYAAANALTNWQAQRIERRMRVSFVGKLETSGQQVSGLLDSLLLIFK